MGKKRVGRPKTLTEKMTTIRCRESQRVLLNAMRQDETEPHHKVLSRVLTFFFKKHPKTKKKIRAKLHG